MFSRFSESFSAVISNSINTLLDKVLVIFAQRLMTKIKETYDIEISADTINSAWKEVAPEYDIDIKRSIELEHVKREASLKKLEKKSGGLQCNWVFGKRSKERSNQPCPEVCKEDSVGSDGKHYCSKHLKMVNSRHACEYELKSGEHAGELCGKNVLGKDGSEPHTFQGVEKKTEDGIEMDTVYHDTDYAGKWICGKHTSQLNEGISKGEHPQCKHIFTKCKDEEKNDTQCTSRATKDGFCGKHSKNKKSKEDGEKKNQRKKAIDGEDTKKSAAKPVYKCKNQYTGKAELVSDKFKNDTDDECYAILDITSGLVFADRRVDSSVPLNIKNIQHMTVIGQWDNKSQVYLESVDDDSTINSYLESNNLPTLEVEEVDDEFRDEFTEKDRQEFTPTELQEIKDIADDKNTTLEDAKEIFKKSKKKQYKMSSRN